MSSEFSVIFTRDHMEAVRIGARELATSAHSDAARVLGELSHAMTKAAGDSPDSQRSVTIRPGGYELDLSSFQPCLYDSCAGEAVAWGFKLIRRMSDERFQSLHQYGELHCTYPDWFLITRKLTRVEAIARYGDVSDEKFGPRGGWKSVTFGTKRFCSQFLRP